MRMGFLFFLSDKGKHLFKQVFYSLVFCLLNVFILCLGVCAGTGVEVR